MKRPSEYFDSELDLGSGLIGSVFLLPPRFGSRKLVCISTTEPEMEHVSVRVIEGKKDRVPNWEEMCYVKDIFFEDEDQCIQFHPRRSEYVNIHSSVLHIWHPIVPITLEP